MIKRVSRIFEGGIAALATNGWRVLPVFAVVLLALVLGSLMLTPMNALWSKNLVIKGGVDVRDVPERCEDMQFDSYFWGTNGDDRIDGTEGNDMIWGLNGHDQIYGHGGSDCFDGGDDDDKCDDDDGWYDADEEHSSYDVNWGEHESKRNSCDQWGSRFQTTSWWHHSTPTIELGWAAVEGAGYYNVYRSTDSGGPYTGIGSTPVPAYTDTDILEDTTYYYVITAVDADGFESVPSAETAQLVPSTADTPVAADTPAPTQAPPPADAAPSEPTATPLPEPASTPPPEPTATPLPEPTADPSPTATPAPELVPEPTITPDPSAATEASQ
jgi:hypothetical protein